MKSLISKNLAAHRLRNRRTGVMYAFSLGFVVLLYTMNTLELQVTKFEYTQRQGADLHMHLYGENSIETTNT